MSLVSAAADEAWILYNKNYSDWSTKLSYQILKTKGLINCYNEYKSIKDAFYYKNVTPKFVIKWLHNQKGNFRVSYLSHILISGYSKCLRPNNSYVSIDVESIINAYCNITFIKLYETGNSKKYELRTFDTNLTVNNLIKILEAETGNHVRLWSRFNPIKFVYSAMRNAENKENTEITCDSAVISNGEAAKKWVQIPDCKCSSLTIKEIDNQLQYDKILEFGVDRFRKIYFDRNISIDKWTFMETLNNYTNVENRLDWICSLTTGDIIDVYYGMKWNEAFIVSREYDTFYICLVYDHSFTCHKIKSIGFDLNRLQRRYTYCKYYDHSLLNNMRKFDKLVYCQWVTAFTGHSLCYPILIE